MTDRHRHAPVLERTGRVHAFVLEYEARTLGKRRDRLPRHQGRIAFGKRDDVLVPDLGKHQVPEPPHPRPGEPIWAVGPVGEPGRYFRGWVVADNGQEPFTGPAPRGGFEEVEPLGAVIALEPGTHRKILAPTRSGLVSRTTEV